MTVEYAFSHASQNIELMDFDLQYVSVRKQQLIHSFLLWFPAMFQCPRFSTDRPILFPWSASFEEKFSSSGSNNEAILVRTSLCVVAVILLSKFLLSIMNWSVIMSRRSPKTLVMVSFMWSCPAIFLYSSIEQEFQSRSLIYQGINSPPLSTVSVPLPCCFLQ